MDLLVRKIAEMVGGEVSGNSDQHINNVATLEKAGENDLSFYANKKYEALLYSTAAAVVLVPVDFKPHRPISSTLIFVKDPYSAFTLILGEFEKQLQQEVTGIEQPSFQSATAIVGTGCYLGAFSYVGNNTKIGDDVKIYPQTYIGHNVTIGKNTIVYAGVKIYDGCTIGSGCVIHSGAVVGSDGFGFAPQQDGSYKTIPQLGTVNIEDNVSIGANTVIDCATMLGDHTLLKKGVKIDNLVQIAHNVRIGNDTVIAAQTGIAGSTTLGARCMVGGQAGFEGHISIADETKVGAQTGVLRSTVTPGEKLMGSPALGLTEYYKAYSVFRKLPDLKKQIEQLEEKILNSR